ncbi:hypothetical protein ACFVHB_28735 [Kitasatospora sp. NPDC127111]|uniref:hypothetical protein n=1 Tax=Kitasatospora sp. NPDC127111 TaxID=3345363 RepID=UPI0036385340
MLPAAVATHLVDHDPAAESRAAPAHLVIMGILALADWPADRRDLVRAPALPTGTPRPTT